MMVTMFDMRETSMPDNALLEKQIIAVAYKLRLSPLIVEKDYLEQIY